MTTSATVPPAAGVPAGPSWLDMFLATGALGPGEAGVARGLLRIGTAAGWDLSPQPGDADLVELATALCVLALRQGSVCIDLTAPTPVLPAQGEAPAPVTWPDPGETVAALARSPLVALGPQAPDPAPLRLVDGLLYLDRYWAYERSVAREVTTRLAHRPTVDEQRLAAALVRLFPDPHPARLDLRPGTAGAGSARQPRPGPDEQRVAAAVAALRGYTVITGGPGTGKTTTVAKVLAALAEAADTPPRIALAAPTGKAAKRLTEVVDALLAAPPFTPADRDRLGSPTAVTLHRLLGFLPGAGDRFRHHQLNPLPYDVVVVDETSMVPLVMMARLLQALPGHARLILVGDAGQLASVEAGAVLADLVARPASDDPDLTAAIARVSPPDAGTIVTGGVVHLTVNHRAEGQDLVALGTAIRLNQPTTVLDLLAAGDGLELIDTDDLDSPAALAGLHADITTLGTQLVAAGRAGDAGAALDLMNRHRLLCAHNEGPHGIRRWNQQARHWIAAACADPSIDTAPWYPGQPVLVTRNDYSLDLYNGDTGVIITDPHGLRAAFAGPGGTVRTIAPARLDGLVELQAMTVHKGQGSEYDCITLLLPGPESPLLTREMLYTAVTRAKRHVRIIGTRAAVEAAVDREIRRASGLRRSAE